jgi:hypothetical protein
MSSRADAFVLTLTGLDALLHFIPMTARLAIGKTPSLPRATRRRTERKEALNHLQNVGFQHLRTIVCVTILNLGARQW